MRPGVVLLILLLLLASRLAAGEPPAAPPGPSVGIAVAPGGESCYAAKDLVVQALERLRADSTSPQLIDANELLKRATDLCTESGEAWYYRSLVEAKLSNMPRSDYAMRQATRFRSEALEQRLNPFILATPPPSEAKPLPSIHQRWALVVGIGAFADTTVKSLAYTTGDAQSFRDLLVDPKGGAIPTENIRFLTDETATLRGIKEGLNWLARSAGPDDLVVVYIASHGSARDADTAGANYILAHDTELGADVNPDLLYATALPMVELANDVATRLQSRRTAVFLDTCFSGGAFAAGSSAGTAGPSEGNGRALTAGDRQLAPGIASASISKNTLDQMGQGTGRIIFAASRTDQQSLESATLHHGYFTWFLVQALRAAPRPTPQSDLHLRPAARHLPGRHRLRPLQPPPDPRHEPQLPHHRFLPGYHRKHRRKLPGRAMMGKSTGARERRGVPSTRVGSWLRFLLFLFVPFSLWVATDVWSLDLDSSKGECSLQESEHGNRIEKFAYNWLMRRRFVEPASHPVALITLTPSSEPLRIHTNTCEGRKFIAALVPELAHLGARVIAIDKFYSEGSCIDDAVNQHLQEALNSVAIPIVAGQAVERVEGDLHKGCLVLTPPFNFESAPRPGITARPANVHLGLIRLNENTLQIPLQWPVFTRQPEDDGDATPPRSELRDSFALKAAETADPTLAGNCRSAIPASATTTSVRSL